MSSERKITLRSSDGEDFEVDVAVAMQSQTIKITLEDDDDYCADCTIPLPLVTGKTLAPVVEYCKKHADESSAAAKEDLKTWDDEFAKSIELEKLFDLVHAANYLHIRSLLDLTAQTIADMIKETSVEDVRKVFKIVNDFTPEEEAKVRDEFPWVFDP